VGIVLAREFGNMFVAGYVMLVELDDLDCFSVQQFCFFQKTV